MFARTGMLAGLSILCLCPNATASNVVVHGTLERLQPGSISVRLTDGRLIDARISDTATLTAGSIAEQFKLADQVRMTCEEIETVYDAQAFVHQHLELKSLKRVHAASPGEVAIATIAASWRTGENLLAPPSGTASQGEPAELDRVRTVNLDFGSKLPNFVADETAIRYLSRFDNPKWNHSDTVESEIAFNGVRAARQHIRLDGKPWAAPFEQLPGYRWAVWFGLELRPLFSHDCPTTIQFDGREPWRGQNMLAYRFASPENSCFVGYGVGDSRYIPARTGRFLAEDPGGHMMRFETEAYGFPPDGQLDRSTVVETWDYVKIADGTFLLPVNAEIVTLTASGVWERVSVTFKNHRHFDASTNIVFH